MLAKTAAACATTAAIILVISLALGRWEGLAGAIGILFGALNASASLLSWSYLSENFRILSLCRLVILSGMAVGVGSLMGWHYIPWVLGGLAVVQLLVAGMGVWQAISDKKSDKKVVGA